ncbi:MAG: hypothetical protein ACYTGC_20130 [Planctomycetota bacterium]|jgi:hypothetical protein
MIRRINNRIDRLLLRRYPEIQLFPDEEARIEAQRRAGERLDQSNSYWFQLVGMAIVFLGVGALVWRVVPTINWLRPALGLLRVGILVVGTLGFILAIMLHWRARMIGLMRDQLNEMGLLVCRSCGYPMSAIHGDRCPECGTRRR